MHKKINDPLLWLAFAVFSLTLLPRLLSEGMFFDGVTYASIARNLADGLGTIWNPYYTETVYPVFHEHPPFAFFLRSALYKVFPDSIYVESFYGFFIGILIIYLIHLARGFSTKSSESISSLWSVMLLFSIAPITSWILSANLLELELTIFSLLAVILPLRAETRSSGRRVLLLLASGVCVAAAFLVKGPTALFPLATPILMFLVYGNVRSMVAYFFSWVNAILGFFLPMAALWFLSPKFQGFLQSYFEVQVMRSIQGARETGSRFTILESMVNETILPLILCLILVLVYRKKINQRITMSKPAILFLLVGLSASLPILVSPKQSRFYFFPALPYFILSISLVFGNQLQALHESVARSLKAPKIIRMISVLMILVSIFLLIQQKNRPRREQEFHMDFSLHKLEIPPRQLVSVYPPELESNWPIVAYMQRQFKASLTGKLGNTYLMTEARFLEKAEIMNDYKIIHPRQPVKYVMLQKK